MGWLLILPLPFPSFTSFSYSFCFLIFFFSCSLPIPTKWKSWVPDSLRGLGGMVTDPASHSSLLPLPLVLVLLSSLSLFLLSAYSYQMEILSTWNCKGVRWDGYWSSLSPSLPTFPSWSKDAVWLLKSCTLLAFDVKLRQSLLFSFPRFLALEKLWYYWKTAVLTNFRITF